MIGHYLLSNNDCATTGGASCGPKGAMAPLTLQILHVMNSDFDTVHYCSKRVAPPYSSEIEGQAPPLCATVTFISKSRTERGLFVIASCQAEVEKAAAGGREIPSKHIQREAERECCREEGQCPSTQILDSDLCGC